MGALRGFMAAAKQRDLQALSAFWGDQEGPARDRLPRAELEKREVYMIRCLRHDTYEVVGNSMPIASGLAMVVKLKYRDVSLKRDFSPSTDVQVVRGPAPENRWYVKEVSITKLQDICMLRG